MTRTTVFRGALVAASVSAAVLATACSGAPAAPPAPVPSAPLSTSVAPTATQAPSSSAQQPGQSQQPVAAAAAGLKFPGKSLEVRFYRYDRASGMAEFFLVTLAPNGGAGPHLVDVPGPHRLPLAPNATIESVDPAGFPFETCPPTECSTGIELQSVLSQYGGSGLFADAAVNAADQITDIHEMPY
ncbi:hypothetical protein [Amycolatopsis sp. DSM 110486]|uniref:hypothetical protein n=1 Tax=Amycolatopsis sp. DSM 110486 TaxID=2865832 RepID=UPI001C6A8C83|nr:hypothetical protein [Amycolatopsis sp. DSM 110486]QYN18236.1 hypothetical protein K1T34_36605 [Amycolatopsis sp. DSM 110486]